MKCVVCKNEINLNFFNFFSDEFSFCKNCLNNFDFKFYQDQEICFLYEYDNNAKEFIKQIDKGDYILAYLFKDILEFYINFYLDCKKIIFYNYVYILDVINIQCSGDYIYIFTLFIDQSILKSIYLKYNFKFKIVSIFADKNFIKQRKLVLKMI